MLLRWALAGTLLAALLAAPATSAGTRIASVTVADNALVPDEQSTLVTALGEVDCASLLLRRPVGQLSQVLMHAGWSGENMSLSGAVDVLVDPAPCTTGATVVPVTTTWNAHVFLEAPALVAQAGEVWWDFDEHALDEQDPVRAEGRFALRAAAINVPQVNFPAQQAILASEPSAIFRITVLNLGNIAFDAGAAATMTVDVRGNPGDPAPVHATSALVPRDGEGEIVVTAESPSGRWTTAKVRGEVTITPGIDGAGPPRVVPFEFLLVHEPNGKESTPPAGVVPLVVGLAALAWRRRAGT